MIKKAPLLITFLLTITQFLPTQAQLKLPNTDIYLIPISKVDTGYTFGSATLISNWPGYDNQPSFSIESDNIYYSTIRELDKTDIYMYSINSKENLPFIETGSVSEFSPYLTPDGTGLSVVRQDAVGTQQIWIHYFDGRDPLCITPQLTNVGYYCWIDSDEIALRVELTDTTSKLEWLNIRTKKIKEISAAPGIGLSKVPAQRQIYYIDKSHSTARLMRYDAETGKSDSLITVPAGIDNFTTTIENEVWLINKGALYSWNGYHPNGWKKIYEFPEGILQNSYRLATSRNMKWLAVVVMPVKK